MEVPQVGQQKELSCVNAMRAATGDHAPARLTSRNCLRCLKRTRQYQVMRETIVYKIGHDSIKYSLDSIFAHLARQ